MICLLKKVSVVLFKSLNFLLLLIIFYRLFYLLLHKFAIGNLKLKLKL